MQNDTDINNLFDIIGRKYLDPNYYFQKEEFKKVEEKKELEENKKKDNFKRC